MVDFLQAEVTLELDFGQREAFAKLWIGIVMMIYFIVSVICKEFTVSINTRLKLMQFKWIMHTYITPSLLHHFDNNHPDLIKYMA